MSSSQTGHCYGEIKVICTNKHDWKRGTQYNTKSFNIKISDWRKRGTRYNTKSSSAAAEALPVRGLYSPGHMGRHTSASGGILTGSPTHPCWGGRGQFLRGKPVLHRKVPIFASAQEPRAFIDSTITVSPDVTRRNTSSSENGHWYNGTMIL
eukprot:gene25912-biopygen11682